MDATPHRLVVIIFYQVDQLQTSGGARLRDMKRGAIQSPARLRQEEGNKTITSRLIQEEGNKTITGETKTGRGEQDNHQQTDTGRGEQDNHRRD